MKRLILILIAVFISVSVFSADPPKPVAIENIGPITVAKYKAKLGYETKTEAEAKYLQITNADTAAYYTAPEVDAFIGLKRIQFIANVTANAPITGDSIFFLSDFQTKHVKLIRAGAVQYFNTTATNGKLGFRQNSTIGFIVVRPAFVASELVQIELSNEPNWTYPTLPVLQNLMKYSEDLSGAAWSIVLGTLIVDQEYDLTGQLTLDKVQFDDNAEQIRYLDGGTQVNVTAGDTYRLSFDVNKGTTTQLILQIFNGSTYIETFNYWPQIGATVTRINYSFTIPVGTTNIRPILARNSLQSGKYAFFGRVQMDKIGSNYVKTTTATKP